MRKKEREEICNNTKIKSIRIYCGKLNHSVVIPWEKCSINAQESPCDLCGSHGYKEVEVECVCGLKHTIDVDSW